MGNMDRLGICSSCVHNKACHAVRLKQPHVSHHNFYLQVSFSLLILNMTCFVAILWLHHKIKYHQKQLISNGSQCCGQLFMWAVLAEHRCHVCEKRLNQFVWKYNYELSDIFWILLLQGQARKRPNTVLPKLLLTCCWEYRMDRHQKMKGETG